MFKFFKKLKSNEIDFRPYSQKENDFKRLAVINLVVCLIITPLFSFLIKDTEISQVYFYLGLSYTFIFPLYMIFCWYVPYFRNKLFLFFIFHIFAMTLVAFIDLVENNFNIIDLFTFYCLFAVSIFVIQRYYFGMIYVVYVLCLVIYSFSFINDNLLVPKKIILSFIGLLSFSALLSYYVRNRMLFSIFDFNTYLKKVSQGEKFGFFLFKISKESIIVLDFDEYIGNIFTGSDKSSKDQLSIILNDKITKNDLKNLVKLSEDQYLTKIIKLNDKSFELVLSPIRFKKFNYFLVKTNNVTDRIKEQEELILSENKYRNLYNKNQAGVFTLDDTFHLINFNTTFDLMFENTFKIGDSIVNDIELNELFEIIFDKHQINNYQTHFTIKNDLVKWFVFNFYYDSQNNLIEGTVVDVSEIQKTTDALIKSEEKYKIIYEESNDAILLFENDKILDVNRRGMQLFGLPKEDFLSINLWDLTYDMTSLNNFIFKKYIHKLHSTGNVKFNWIFKGRFHPIEAEVAIVELTIGTQIINQCVIHDVTEKNNTIRALEKSTQNFRSVLETIPEGIIIYNDNDVLYSNKEVYHLIENEVIDFDNLFIDEDQIKFKELLIKKQLDKNNIELQLTIKTASGSKLIDLTLVNTIFGATDAILIILKDISIQMQLSKEVLRAELAEDNTKKLESEIKVRIKTEKELQNLLLKTQAIYDSSSNILLMTLDLQRNITYSNKHSILYFNNLLDKSIELNTDLVSYFTDFYSRKQINFFKNTLKKILNGKSIVFELEFKNDKGSNWLEIFMNPIYDTDGLISEVSLLAHDITLKKDAESGIINSLKEKEILLKEIHHRVKNNLQVISSILNLQSSFLTDKETIEVLQESRNRIRSMSIIHENLYRTTNFSSIDFANYIKNLVINLTSLFHNNFYKVDIEYDLQPVEISLDQAVPSGLIMNELITNSLKYAFANNSTDNKLFISMKETNNIIELRVRDNGIGLPNNYSFENSETLGLQLVFTLVDQLDASISFVNENGIDFLISFEKL